MQTSLSELLVAEHNVILEAGKLIESSNKLWETDPVAYSKQVSFLTDFFSEYGDEFHHQKEEEILFPAINKANEMVGASIVSELIEHHEDFATCFRKYAMPVRSRTMFLPKNIWKHTCKALRII